MKKIVRYKNPHKRFNPNRLSQSTIEKLGNYVYLLIDPDTGRIFYVGKGRGNRINHHLLDALKESPEEKEKIKTIKKIEAAGKKVRLDILRHGLMQEEAFKIESVAIDLLGVKNLTNLVSGYRAEDRGRMSLNDLKIEYEAEEANFEEPVILININRLFRSDMSQDEIYNATKGNWKIDRNRAGGRMVCSVYRGIIREVFMVNQWSPSSLKGRLCFDGNRAPAKIRKKYLYKSVARYWPMGAQNPIKYIN